LCTAAGTLASPQAGAIMVTLCRVTLGRTLPVRDAA
jgi:hypothetical protein